MELKRVGFFLLKARHKKMDLFKAGLMKKQDISSQYERNQRNEYGN